MIFISVTGTNLGNASRPPLPGSEVYECGGRGNARCDKTATYTCADLPCTNGTQWAVSEKFVSDKFVNMYACIRDDTTSCQYVKMECGKWYRYSFMNCVGNASVAILGFQKDCK